MAKVALAEDLHADDALAAVGIGGIEENGGREFIAFHGASLWRMFEAACLSFRRSGERIGYRGLGSRSGPRETCGKMRLLLGSVVVSPPFAPGARVSSEGGACDGLQRSVDEVLSRRVKGIVIEEIQKLGDGGEALLTREHAGTREIYCSAFANLFRGIVGQNGKKRVDGFRGTQHGQSFDGPEARLLIRIARIAKELGQNRGGLDAAIAEGAESPEREIAAARIIMNLMEKFCDALRRLPEVVGDEIDFHGGDAHARIVGVQSRKDKMEELIGVFQVPAPGIQISVDQNERLLGAAEGKFEEAFGLLLGRQAADRFDIGVVGAGTGSGFQRGRLEGSGRQRWSCAEPSEPEDFKARHFVTGDGGKGGKQQENGDEAEQTVRGFRYPMCSTLQTWSGLRSPGDVFHRIVHGLCESAAFRAP
jgi:hypothetical protein